MNLDVLEAQTYGSMKRRAVEGYFQRIFQRINSTFPENSAFRENFEFLEKFHTHFLKSGKSHKFDPLSIIY